MSQATAALKKDSQAEHHEELSFLYIVMMRETFPCKTK